MPKEPQPSALMDLLDRATVDPALAARLRAIGYEVKPAVPFHLRDTDPDERVKPEPEFEPVATTIYAASTAAQAPTATDASDARPIYPTPAVPAQTVPDSPGESPDAPKPRDFEWGYVPPKRSKTGQGRFRKVAPWYEEVSSTMADGTSLRVALVRCGVALSKREIDLLYHSRAFKDMYRRKRREFLKTWGRRKIRKGASIHDFHRGPRD